MRLSVVIVNWNTTRLLQTLLRSIKQFPPSIDYEVIVVDNASSDFDADKFRSEFNDVTLIANTENTGYAKGNNQALKIASGDYVLLLNPDTEVTEGAINTLIQFIETHADTAAVAAKLVKPDGSVDRSLRSFPYPGPIAWEFIGLSRLFPKNRAFGAYRMTYFNYDTVAEVDQPMGSCLMLSRKAINDIGLLDEDFPIFFNEVDWLYRAKQQGYKIYFTPDAMIIHHGASSTKQVRKRKMVRESHDSLLKFYKKHFKSKVFAPVYYFTIACILISRRLRG